MGGSADYLLVFEKCSIDYTIERIIWGHDLLQSSRQGPLGWLATAMMLVPAEDCMPLPLTLS